MAQYVEKLKIAVRVGQLEEEPMEGFFSLASSSRLRDGPETLLERLNENQRVIPFHAQDDEGTLLLNRLAIAWVSAGAEVEPARVCPGSFRVTREERVRVRLRDGSEIEGLLRMEMPEWYNRASDFMNGEEDFFPLVTREGMVLINKRHVAHTRLFESSPAPVF